MNFPQETSRDRGDASDTSSLRISGISRLDYQTLSSHLFLKNYRQNGVPVIIKGLVNEPDWTLEYLSQQFGDREFLCRFYGAERKTLDKHQWDSIGSGIDAKPLPFSKYAELVRSGEARRQDIYLAKCPLKTTPLDRSTSLHQWGQKLGFEKAASDLNLWIGPGGHIESLHYDAFDGTLAQLHGRKHLALFPPSQLKNLYPFPLIKHLTQGLKLRSWFSQVDLDRPNFESFPKLKDALNDRIDVILHPGELLYIPSGWWHEVTALDDPLVCSVNRFWHVRPRRRSLLSESAWRTYFGIGLSIPYLLSQLAIAALKPNASQEIEKIRRMF
ncbi:cupin-like domain-containing protein [Baaleninema simplex]|uniref:cupin-like domain-containing protein n=1 Tax=Baaleninema simplex TaxID=2862350 RepID=UPI00034ACA84|nr:cupin-like domain-containing protein [Baaleninema simplex]